MTDSNRREFIGGAAGTAAFSIVPRHVLGGAGYIAPSDKIALACVGVGTEGIREMLPVLEIPEIQIVAVCDVNKSAVGYKDWSRDGILNSIRRTIGKPNWGVGSESIIPGGRDMAKDVVETYYANKQPSGNYKGCAAYADYREMLEKESGLDALRILTPDHSHGVISINAMRKRKHVIVHKPIANRLKEARLVIDVAKETGVATHFLPWDANGSMEQVMAWIKGGAIGTLREVHNWTNRPVWPQYPVIPPDTPPVPTGFDWNLWLGPEAERPYHPHYTHMVFRGWYDFGAGTFADMGHYSLWTVFNALELEAPTSIEPMLSHHCVFSENSARTPKNDYSFPEASIVRMRYPARGQRAPVDLIWYDGGMHPTTPDELDEDGKQFEREGMMFVGDKGKILAGFHVNEPRLIPERRMSGSRRPEPPARGRRQAGETSSGMKEWMAAVRGGDKRTKGSFLNAWPISEAVNLWAVALRAGEKIVYDAQNMRITNNAGANKYLAREYRAGFGPA